MPFNEYMLCTDNDLARLLYNLSSSDTAYGWEKREIAKVKTELARREKLGRTSLIREFRKKSKLSS
jgi:hypothetical protein